MEDVIGKLKRVFRVEPVDQVPVAIPVEFRKSESMDERIRRIIEHSLSQEAHRQGFEDFDEANDFDIPDDPVDPSTPWEQDYDLSIAHAVDAGVVKKPEMSAEKQVEIKQKVKEARSRKSKDQVELEDAIAEGFKKAQIKPSDDA